MKATFKVQGMEKTIANIAKIGNVPQKHVTASARKGMRIVLRDAKANAPYDTGMLKKGIILHGERSKLKGKKVYQLIFDPKMNDIFQKVNKQGKVGGYYPVSQEYGYFTVNGRFIPGYRFIHDSFNSNAASMQKEMTMEMKKRVDAEVRKVGMK